MYFFYYHGILISCFLVLLFLLLRYSAASVIDTSSKYKFLWKLPLEDVEVVKSKNLFFNNPLKGIYISSL